MSLINMPRDERDAIDEINVDILRKLVEQCLRDERPDALQSLRLQSCGLYVASRLQDFENSKTRCQSSGRQNLQKNARIRKLTQVGQLEI